MTSLSSTDSRPAPLRALAGRNNTVGIVGGGQLGRMLVHAAQQLGYATCVLDPDPLGPAARASDSCLAAAYDDPAALQALSERCAWVTTEFENVPAQSLASLASRCVVSPQADAVLVAQDRLREKAFFTACADAARAASTEAAGCGESGLPEPVYPAPYMAIATAQDLAKVPDALLPGVLKTTQLGYDGKGQARVADRAELGAAWAQMGSAMCVLEQLMPLAYELSVIVARGADGVVVHLPVQTNVHRAGVLHQTTVLQSQEVEIDEKTAVSDQNKPYVQYPRSLFAAKNIADRLNYVGVLCVEFFVLRDGRLVVNEMAPRPHNSGHYSLEACDYSQFDLQLRALVGLPLVQPTLLRSAVMFNLLGDLWLGPAGEPRTPRFAEVCALPGASLHLYGKAQARAGRKMGHLTLTANTDAAVLALAVQTAHLLGFEAAGLQPASRASA